MRSIQEKGFKNFLSEVEASALSDTFWTVTLPQNLETSSVNSPAFNVFLAAQVHLNYNSLLMNGIKVSDLITVAGDIHHIFPRAYLKKNGVDSKTKYNQVANYIYLDTQVNKAISDDAPCDYFSKAFMQCETKAIELGNICNLSQLNENVLIKSSGSDAQPFHSQNYPIAFYDPSISKYFKSISLVHKLQETRAFVGFSRAEPKELPISERKKMLRIGDDNWLPAIRVQGEGIFFEFNKSEVENWAKQPAVVERLKNLQTAYKKSRFGANSSGNLRPEFVLIHTFAHLLINQLSFECGYGSSSIRERIYCEKTDNEYGMYGVLIYTASGDSEGSLGGLVRQGTKGHIEDTVRDAIRNAAWCSSDPVCIQSLGQGPESCNLAACHNCALLPETCCECGNRLLDRGTVVGTLDDKSIGFFAEILE